MIRDLTLWLDKRTGWWSSVRAFFNERIPASAGWPQAIGSAALFLFLVQAFTGVLLSLNFAGTSGEAYHSLKYIVQEVTGGRMIRGLHHWGASLLVVVLVLHMIQVFLYGAYKRPREVTWMAGVVLLLMTLGFALTGYLLPWDNRAYWGTVVTTEIAGQAPVLGPYVKRMMGAEHGVGALTYARFYALHTAVLPVTALLLIGLHLYLVRRHGVTPAAADTLPGHPFFPRQALKDTVAMFVAFVTLFVLAAAVPVPLDGIADPTEDGYTPRPEWYFLFLFQALKFFEGPLEPVGSVVLPTVAVAALLAVPFLDRSGVKRVAQRTFAIGLVVLCLAGWASLTLAAVVTTPPGLGGTNGGTVEGWAMAAPVDLAGVGYLRAARCAGCHDLAGESPKEGPTLAGLVPQKSQRWLAEHVKGVLDEEQFDTVELFLRRLTPESARVLLDAPADIVAGAQIFVANNCSACHTINGMGGQLGPVLNGVGRRRTGEAIARMIADPESQVPGTMMPPFDLSGRERDALIGYLLSLPGR